MTTQAERRAATSSALVDSARQLFAERGFHGVSIDDIAGDAGVTRGALYHHFTGKEAIFETVFRAEEARLRDELLDKVAHIADPREQLLGGCEIFIGLVARPENRQILLLDGPSVLGMALYRQIDQEHFLDLIASALGRLHPNDSAEVNNLVGVALITACCELSLRRADGDVDADLVAATLTRLIPSYSK